MTVSDVVMVASTVTVWKTSSFCAGISVVRKASEATGVGPATEVWRVVASEIEDVGVESEVGETDAGEALMIEDLKSGPLADLTNVCGEGGLLLVHERIDLWSTRVRGTRSLR